MKTTEQQIEDLEVSIRVCKLKLVDIKLEMKDAMLCERSDKLDELHYHNQKIDSMKDEKRKIEEKYFSW